ncbi:hypothetical protein QKU48_gp0890 [Fadolivirus algeromassiliense]|jgi:hypothetical protein|uniref:Uncharacterized protein n=1 Tax=Fadolivirus FV1/VV64 TaxID=3070911 RepID=A0A7D3UQ68_9VIRU|nr:hypothetical protein QKU48_gp0890 [Fadolivirus algeromassiliense]QKF94348.1 hypothetical protein Fadolivirus_1_890 [Fadolivirus FV1/VV64]
MVNSDTEKQCIYCGISNTERNFTYSSTINGVKYYKPYCIECRKIVRFNDVLKKHNIDERICPNCGISSTKALFNYNRRNNYFSISSLCKQCEGNQIPEKKCIDCGKTSEEVIFRKKYKKSKKLLNRCINCLNENRRKKEIGENYILNSIIAHCKHVDKKKFPNQEIITIQQLKELLIKQNYKCIITGIKMSFNKNDIYQCSIDRLDNKKGHTYENCRLVLLGINYMKGDLDEIIFKNFINYIINPNKLNDNSYIYNKKMLLSKYQSLKRGAYTRNIDFNLSFNDLLTIIKIYNNKCIITNIPIEWKRRSMFIGSFDRIDNKKGYDLNNIQLTLWPINRAKNKFTNTDIKDLVDKIKTNQINHII